MYVNRERESKYDKILTISKSKWRVCRFEIIQDKMLEDKEFSNALIFWIFITCLINDSKVPCLLFCEIYYLIHNKLTENVYGILLLNGSSSTV